ncbi:Hypothetical predicted protein [Cloeon dipterum]|uniref:Uncharacterized protein n=1 Tax=Cloeon dipterum TaxID=197152 RepID=A0A8S1DZX7_9INSE|nr:Hypothetical predicted protein [Cloeon dipterum]
MSTETKKTDSVHLHEVAVIWDENGPPRLGYSQGLDFYYARYSPPINPTYSTSKPACNNISGQRVLGSRSQEERVQRLHNDQDFRSTSL